MLAVINKVQKIKFLICMIMYSKLTLFIPTDQ